MAHYVKIAGGIVVAEQGGPDDLSKEQICGSGEDAEQFVEAPPSVRVGYVQQEDGSFVAPPPAPAITGPTITSKADLFRRCTDAEAEAIETALAAQSVRKRRIFETAQYISSEDPDFADLRAAAVEMFGAERAAELLAASV
ncbi:hypothetical protein [Methylobacterium frigidaeris]|uniref:Uncharacterized protein n=1 Tax=Methylobacterium frigidaeris TaxID=2038277 RepID=A0AA37HD34_9HYPH|nr:hypothetical protein [Methylobacterium frigidaeris]GJD63740.1 hypothetical protein MPEAHAMD_3911 [Methylobacterium frigidaeris]